MRDLHNHIKVLPVIVPQLTTTDVTGTVIDRLGYDAVEFVITKGATASTADLTPVVVHGTATGSLTSAADADLIGTESQLADAAGAEKIGYIGINRYVSVNLTATGTLATGGEPVCVTAVLSKAHIQPTE